MFEWAKEKKNMPLNFPAWMFSLFLLTLKCFHAVQKMRIYRICLYKQLSLMLLNYEKYKPRSCLSDLFVINEYFRLVYINQES